MTLTQVLVFLSFEGTVHPKLRDAFVRRDKRNKIKSRDMREDRKKSFKDGQSSEIMKP